jgi:hydroxylamine reductase (hybrid-cluster protein)
MRRNLSRTGIMRERREEKRREEKRREEKRREEKRREEKRREEEKTSLLVSKKLIQHEFEDKIHKQALYF